MLTFERERLESWIVWVQAYGLVREALDGAFGFKGGLEFSSYR